MEKNMKTIDKKLEHIAFIMDGNGRWAKKRGLSRNVGHQRGAKTLLKVVKHIQKLGIPYMSVYAFSTENWSRPKEEVDYLMKLPFDFLEENEKIFQEEQIKIQVIGDKAQLPIELQHKIQEVEEKTKNYQGFTLIVCLNYGELIFATKQIADKVSQGTLNISDINETIFQEHLYNKEIPDVDLLIRTSGETRISNYMLWQIAYSELYFTKTLWPDMTKKQIEEAILFYQNKERRFGGIK